MNRAKVPYPVAGQVGDLLCDARQGELAVGLESRGAEPRAVQLALEAVADLLGRLEYSPRLPGSRVLEDHYGVNRITMVVARLSYVSEFIEEAKASGLVQRAIERDGSGGYQAVSPENPNARK